MSEAYKKQLMDILIRETAIAIKAMIERGDVSHSFNVVNDSQVSYTALILFTPSELDPAIFNALKPIIEAHCGEGTMVEPNPRASKLRRAIRGH